jgi:hypothetical protein
MPPRNTSRRTNKVIEDPAVTDYLAQIGARLTKNLPLTKLRFQFFLVAAKRERRRESLHGLLSKQQLSPPLRSNIRHLRVSLTCPKLMSLFFRVRLQCCVSPAMGSACLS